MDIKKFMAQDDELPLDNLVDDGGFFKIFRKVACIGDSLASGEFESRMPGAGSGYHDFYEYSWGQYMARAAGVEVLNFSRGGMTAKEYCTTFADLKGLWEEDKLCQAYIIALGVNDIANQNQELGSIDDINTGNTYLNKPNFAGYYARIIQILKTKQPHAKFFLMTMPRHGEPEKDERRRRHAELLYAMADLFSNTYVIDLYKYAPVYDKDFCDNFFLAGHMNPAGYVLTAKMVMSYIDYLVRHNPKDFAQAGFIGKPYHNYDEKWT